ncbi:unnamed protein product [Paramecium primaurelia]|uniref:Protein kinase domain-containing protein n=1 Tax=Paramecium primaurelia TaxID=5886 RepID=A0A8S1QEZ2_PARPR|nr:unnamed protein product [Paramecium primaurelia]
MNSSQDIIKIQSYEIYKDLEIGRGQFGVVYQCKDLDKPQLKLCAKIIEEKIDDEKTLREIQLMKMIMTGAKGNKNIVGVEYVDFNTERIVLILEKCECDLQSIIDKKQKIEKKNFTPDEALNVLKQLINGYKVLYSNNIIHRDLKPANILVLDGFYKIADLGLARVFEANTTMTKVGTPKYVAPQLYLENFFSNSADIFSLGIITYELIFGGLPYVANSQLQIKKALKNLEQNPVVVKRDHPGMTNDLAILIESMLKFKENDRISWEQLFKHPLIQSESNVVMNQSGLIQDFPNKDDEEDDEPVQEQQKPIEAPKNQSQVPQQSPTLPIPTFNGPMQFQQNGKPINIPPTMNPQFQQGRISTPTMVNANIFVPPGVQQQRQQMVFQPQRFQTINAPMIQPNGPMIQPNAPMIQPNAPMIQPNAPMANIGQTFQFQQVQAQSDQLYQAGFAMDLTLDLLERFINMQIQLKQEWFGLKLYLHYFSQCFFEHSKAMKMPNQNQQNLNQQFIYQLSNAEQGIEKQKRYHQVIQQELERHQLISLYPVSDVTPDFNNYLQKLKQILQPKGVFFYQSDRKYYVEYLQLLYCLERLKDLNSNKFEDIYSQISDIFKNQKTESIMIDYLNKRYSN